MPETPQPLSPAPLLSEPAHRNILHRLPLWYIIPFILLIIFLIPALIITILLYQPITKPSLSTKLPSSTPLLTSDPTTNWITYTNQENELQFKYPPDWIYSEKSEQRDVPYQLNTKKIYFKPSSDKSKDELGAFSIWLYEIPNELSLAEFIKTFICYPHPEVTRCVTVEKAIDFTAVHKIAAQKITYHPQISFSESTIFKKGGLIIEMVIDFELPYSQEATTEDKRNTFDLILSTFRFMDHPQDLTIRGVIRTSGLTDEEKKQLKLQYSQYQITDFKTGENEINGYFIESDQFSLDTYQGKCVQMDGAIQSGWEQIIADNFTFNNKYTYHRSVIVPGTIN